MTGAAMVGDHAGAVVALLYLPVVLVAAAIAVERAAEAGSAAALRTRAGFESARGCRRALVLLLTITAAIHLGLVPGHLAENRLLAALFAVDALALTAAAAGGWNPRLRYWRPLVAALLIANLGAYVGYLVAGVEDADAVGIATKAVETVALVLLIHPASGFVARSERGNRPLASKITRRLSG